MKRQPLIQLLDSYLPSEEEILFKKEMLDFVKTNKNCFNRSLEIGHVTASCWLLNTDKSKALLMHHKKLDRWLQLGGHCDGNPDTLAVAVKEAQEESGIFHIRPLSTDIFDIDIHLIPGNGLTKPHYHYDVRFLLQTISNDSFTKNEESKALLWISKDEKKLPTEDPSVTRLFHKWLSKSAFK